MAASAQLGMGALPYAGGVGFRLWAKFASAVNVAGTFNGWSDTATPLTMEGDGYCQPMCRARPFTAPGDERSWRGRRAIKRFPNFAKIGKSLAALGRRMRQLPRQAGYL